jgi:hypothetical protein
MLISFKQKRLYIGIGLVWIALWAIPWGQWSLFEENIYLVFLTDMLHLCIAILAFIFPGALLYLLLGKESEPDSIIRGIGPIGFTFSVAIIALVGLTGRIIGLSFVVVKSVFALIGLLELLIFMASKSKFVVPKKILWNSIRSILRNPPLLVALVLATLMTFHDYLFFIDDTTYLAYLTNWQHSMHLGFRNIVHELDVIEQARFWLAMYPMGQALLADLSGLPGLLLLGNYLELFLVPLAVITSYWLARELGLSPKASGFAVLIQISLYSWMVGDYWPVGTWFYQSMSEDKVSATFILAPVFIVFVLAYLRVPSKNKILLIILSGISLTLTHPVILFLACVIAAGLGLFAWIYSKASWKNFLLLILIFAILMVPYLVIRLSDNPTVAEIPYDAKTASATYEIERYTNILNGVFYGLNPEVLKFFDIKPAIPAYATFQYFRLFPIILGVLVGVLALVNLKKGPLYWYVFSTFLLVLFATLPYTGWLLGYFISARLISRAAWFSPLGIGGVLVIGSLAVRLKLNEKASLYRKSTFMLLISCILFVSPMLVFDIFPRVPFYFSLLEKNKQLAEVGTFIDKNSTDPVMAIALDYGDTQLLPGVSAHTRLISFREEKDYNGFNSFLTIEEIHERINASDAIQSLDSKISVEERCILIEKYHIRFILAESNNAELFKELINSCTRKPRNVFETGKLVLLELGNH